jgi:hypothetical protein
VLPEIAQWRGRPLEEVYSEVLPKVRTVNQLK